MSVVIYDTIEKVVYACKDVSTVWKKGLKSCKSNMKMCKPTAGVELATLKSGYRAS